MTRIGPSKANTNEALIGRVALCLSEWIADEETAEKAAREILGELSLEGGPTNYRHAKYWVPE